jgi:hypothetical protein
MNHLVEPHNNSTLDTTPRHSTCKQAQTCNSHLVRCPSCLLHYNLQVSGQISSSLLLPTSTLQDSCRVNHRIPKLGPKGIPFPRSTVCASSDRISPPPALAFGLSLLRHRDPSLYIPLRYNKTNFPSLRAVIATSTRTYLLVCEASISSRLNSLSYPRQSLQVPHD